MSARLAEPVSTLPVFRLTAFSIAPIASRAATATWWRGVEGQCRARPVAFIAAGTIRVPTAVCRPLRTRDLSSSATDRLDREGEVRVELTCDGILITPA